LQGFCTLAPTHVCHPCATLQDAS